MSGKFQRDENKRAKWGLPSKSSVLAMLVSLALVFVSLVIYAIGSAQPLNEVEESGSVQTIVYTQIVEVQTEPQSTQTPQHISEGNDAFRTKLAVQELKKTEEASCIYLSNGTNKEVSMTAGFYHFEFCTNCSQSVNFVVKVDTFSSVEVMLPDDVVEFGVNIWECKNIDLIELVEFTTFNRTDDIWLDELPYWVKRKVIDRVPIRRGIT